MLNWHFEYIWSLRKIRNYFRLLWEMITCTLRNYIVDENMLKKVLLAIRNVAVSEGWAKKQAMSLGIKTFTVAVPAESVVYLMFIVRYAFINFLIHS